MLAFQKQKVNKESLTAIIADIYRAIYNGGKELEWLLEQLHDLAHEVDPEEAEKILALCADISRFDRERRPA